MDAKIRKIGVYIYQLQYFLMEIDVDTQQTHGFEIPPPPPYHFNNVRKSILHIQQILTISYWTRALYPYWGHRGRNRIVDGFATTHAVSAYHHWCREFESRSGWGVQHYEIKFVSDLRQVGGFLRVLRFPSPIKLTATI